MSGEVVTAVPRIHRRARFVVTVVALAVATTAVCLLSLSLGQYSLRVSDIIAVLLLFATPSDSAAARRRSRALWA